MSSLPSEVYTSSGDLTDSNSENPNIPTNSEINNLPSVLRLVVVSYICEVCSDPTKKCFWFNCKCGHAVRPTLPVGFIARDSFIPKCDPYYESRSDRIIPMGVTDFPCPRCFHVSHVRKTEKSNVDGYFYCKKCDFSEDPLWINSIPSKKSHKIVNYKKSQITAFNNVNLV